MTFHLLAPYSAGTEKAIETLINFDYLIADASWIPNYDIRIKDIDNPFDYKNKGEGGTEVSLKPIHDYIKEMEGMK